MNDISLDVLLDRLVDGELTTAERDQLLPRLEAQPQSWRQCALAFIESQTLRSELRHLREETLGAKPSAVVLASPPARGGLHYWAVGVAMAASFLVALPVGRYLAPAKSADATIVTRKEPTPERESQQVADATAPRPLGRVQLATDDGEIDVPYYSLQDGARYLLDDQDALAESMIDSLERAGHRVEHSPGVMPVQLDNGSQVYLPVDSYRITPVSNRSIQ